MRDFGGERLLVIGGGHMASAILTGTIRHGVLVPGDVVVAEPDSAKREELGKLGVLTASSVAEAVRVDPGTPARVLLAVKPQSLASVAAELAAALPAWGPPSLTVISILAGVRAAAIGERIPSARRVVRVMPNLPAAVGQGATAIAAEPGAEPDPEVEFVERLFRAVGPVVVRIDEPLMDAFTAVAGSGPAYVFYVAEAMARAAAALGFDPRTADAIVRQTIAGAAAMLARDERPPGELRAAVTSRGGTTEAAIRSLDAARVSSAVERAVRAARDRGEELSRLV